MSISKKLMTTGAKGETYVDDVFSTYLYKGTNAPQDIVNGIDLDGEGGLVWMKGRDDGSHSHCLVDTERGVNSVLFSNYTEEAETIGTNPDTDFVSFNSDGFTLGTPSSNGNMNGAGMSKIASWTFRKQPKFFDVVTYRGDNTAAPTIPHNLGVEPGMIIIKSTDTAGNPWYVYHRGCDFPKYCTLNSADAQGTLHGGGLTAPPTAKSFTVTSGAGMTGAESQDYVAYLFAHDDSEEGLIQCGSYTGSNGAGQEIDLGWEPQYVLIKNASRGSSHWVIQDSMRGASDNSYHWLYPDSSEAEGFAGNDSYLTFTSNGFRTLKDNATTDYQSDQYIYMAIRRPNKPPESATEVFNMIERTGTESYAAVTGVGFPLDVVFGIASTLTTSNRLINDRVRGVGQQLLMNKTDIEATAVPGFDYTSLDQDGFKVQSDQYGKVNYLNSSIVNYCIKRAPFFMDVVAYEGDAQSGRRIPHNLGVEPEMIWIKNRTAQSNWGVYSKTHPTGVLNLDATYAVNLSTQSWDNDTPTSEVFPVAPLTGWLTNDLSASYIAYLFASLPGVSKVGSFTGNGGNQTIDCGFTNGARFVLIKRTDGPGNWNLLYNLSASGSDWLYLNTNNNKYYNSEVKAVAAGFSVGDETQVNANNGEYIFYAIA